MRGDGNGEPAWARQPSAHVCDCPNGGERATTYNRHSHMLNGWSGIKFTIRVHSLISDEELSVRHTLVYRDKRHLINRVVRVCDKLVTAFARYRLGSQATMAQRNEADILTLIHIDLYDAVRRVLEDGLEPQGANGWSVVTRTATLGPATRAVHELVAELKENEKMTDEERLRHFFNGLLKQVFLIFV
jgi:hypothetical protein